MGGRRARARSSCCRVRGWTGNTTGISRWIRSIAVRTRSSASSVSTLLGRWSVKAA